MGRTSEVLETEVFDLGGGALVRLGVVVELDEVDDIADREHPWTMRWKERAEGERNEERGVSGG